MQKILSLVRRCVADYHMIAPGERVAVGVSGGKDSLLTLVALAASGWRPSPSTWGCRGWTSPPSRTCAGTWTSPTT